LTHRDHAQAVTFVTGHCQGDVDGLDWTTLAKRGQTLVFYMGLSGLERILAQLCAHGAEPDLPAAVIERGTTVAQRTITGTLTTLAERVRAAEVRSPALLIVGSVAALASELAWFSEAAKESTGNRSSAAIVAEGMTA
jgi:uroporphyrin-III C-methyltransferase/precorrin-2 dehydrogenase/sirohydrochlorin ferrochelatase